jgi:MoxR-like ATPase
MLQTAEDIRLLNERITHSATFIDKIHDELGKVIVGQTHMIERLLIGLLSNGHILLEGVPGLAKTLAIKSLAQTINAKFSRIQFTPDLLPADVTGTMIYNQQKNEFVVRKGPVFANFILADEINRAPAKVQSALLEGYAGKTGHYWKLIIRLRGTFPRFSHPESNRTGRNLSLTGGTG